MLIYHPSTLTTVALRWVKVTSLGPFDTPAKDDAPFTQELEQRALVTFGENKRRQSVTQLELNAILVILCGSGCLVLLMEFASISGTLS